MNKPQPHPDIVKLLEGTLSKHNGFALGEMHLDRAPITWLTNYAKILADNGVKHVLVEGLY